MTPITSPQNQRLKELRRLHRRRERDRSRLFLAEGEDLIQAAHEAGRPAVEMFCAPGTDVAASGTKAGGPDAEVAASGAEIATQAHEVDQDLLASLSTLGSGTRAIGVYEQRYSEPTGPVCVYLHGVSDPGNVGTVLRSALAFGAGCVALGPGCADPHSPKAVRASMGAIFALALARVDDVRELPGERVALVAHAGRSLSEMRVAQPFTLLVGAERDGLPAALVETCEHVTHIPIASESLNAAMAATVALYETLGRVPAS